MKKINPKYKYHLFFFGLLMIISSGFLYKVERNLELTGILVIIGFIIFILSLVL